MSIQVVAILVINTLVILSFLQLSSVQTYLGRILAKDISKKTGFEVKIGKVDIVWLDRVNLEDVEIKDISSNQMIYVNELKVNYHVSSLRNNQNIILDKLVLEQPKVTLSLDDSIALNITDFISSLKKAYRSGTTNKSKPFIIQNIEIQNGFFTYNHLDRDSLQKSFDYNHFGFDSINAVANNLVVVADTFKLTIEQLSGIEVLTGLPIKSLQTNYQLSKAQMKFNNLTLVVGNSVIKDSVTFDYNQTSDLNKFVDKVLISAHFEHLKLATQDLKYFSPYFKEINDTILFSGNIKGHINDFQASNFNLKFGAQSHLKGNAYFEGLPDIFNTFIDLKFKQSILAKNDLAIYIPSESFKKYYPIDSATATVNGSFTGYPKDFVAKASFNTSIGYAQTDLNLKIDNDPTKSEYSGSIKLVDFDLGKAAQSTSVLGKASLVGRIKGTGFTKTSADFVLESQVDKIQIYKYDYQNIETNAHFAQGLFDGFVSIKDPNLKMEANGIIDFRNDRNKIELEGELFKAQLEKLHIRKDISGISAKFNVHIKGIELDSIVGKIDVSELKAHNKDNTYETDHLELISEVKNNERILIFYSERVELKIQGDFNFTSAFKDIKSIWLENKVNFLNQKNNIKSFYQATIIPSSSTNLKFDVKLHNINPLLNLFDPLIHISNNSRLQGKLNTTNDKEFSLTFSNDTIIYDHNLLLNNTLQLNTKSNYQKRDLSVDFRFDSERQKLRSKSTLDSLSVKVKWANDSLNFNLQVQQGKKKNINNINGLMLFKKDTTLLTILQSQIQILHQSWEIQKDNQIMFIKDRVALSNMNIRSGDQSLFASGSISRFSNDPITIIATNIKMENFNPLLKNELNGVLNGKADISRIFDTPLIESNIRIDSFKVDGYIFGNIEGKSNWNQEHELFDVDFFIERQSDKLVNITGSYRPLGDLKALDLNAKLMDADLRLIAPFTKGLFSNIKGSLSGNVFITGPLFEPKLNGSGSIEKAALTIDYLNATFNTVGTWAMDSSSFSLLNMAITDNNIGTGKLNATFSHSNYHNFSMDLKTNFKNLIALNTISKDNKYYYGTAIGTGDLSITGPFSNLLINVRAKTEKDTKFYIPLTSNKSDVSQEEFISFNSFTQEATVESSPIKEQVKLKNITVNLDIEITPDAYSEIIFDLTAGDIIRGRGKGNLSLGLDTKGEFTMIGDYEFTEGAYNFTMYNIINKEFEITPKSNISWSGNPYLGKMDIDAIYKVNTSLAPIMDTIYHDLPEVKRIYPVQVLLDLNGLLLSPDIDFDIVIEKYPRSNVDIDTEVRAFINKIHNEEQELNRQVFSLLVFRNFSPPNSFSTGGTVGSSVSEFVSNQLSYWISQVDDNLTIDFDLGDLDENALQTFQLRVSYAFMEGKLIVTRDGGFTDQNQDATVSSIAGDWTVEYLLSEDGKLRIKIFKKTNYDQLSSSTNSNEELITGGFSLLFTTSFDSIKELFNKNKKQKSSNTNDEAIPKEAIKPEDEVNTP